MIIKYGSSVLVIKIADDEYELHCLDSNLRPTLVDIFDESSTADLQAKELARALAEARN